MSSVRESARHTAAVAVHDPPDQEREQRDDEGNGQSLGKQPHAPRHQFGTMKTVVPT